MPSREETLSLLAAQWEKMPRGSQEERNAVEQFYREKIMPLLVETFVARERPKVTREYDGLILSLGESYQPLVLSIATLKPERVFFLVTEKSRRYLDVVVELTGLKPSQYDYAEVDKDNPLQIYQAIKEIYRRWGRPSSIALDFTGGTKAMSGGSAMAGGMIGADMVYIASSRYLSDLRIPYPGSEHLEFIPNPYQVFGDLEEEKALELMVKYDYAGAGRIFAELARAVPDPRRYQVLGHLARAYEAWDNIDFPVAAAELGQVITMVQQYGRNQKDFVLHDRLGKLKQQHDALVLLSEKTAELKKLLKRNREREAGGIVKLLQDREFVQILMATIYCNALRREEQGKLDMAALLLYRLLEMIEQAALAAYGLDTADPDYSCLLKTSPEGPGTGPATMEELQQRYETLRAKIFKTQPAKVPLPGQVSLFNGYLLLKVIDDPLARDINLHRLNGLIEKRNYSLFAHGFEVVDEEDYAGFKKLVEDIAAAFLAAGGSSLAELLDRYQFLRPPF